MDLELWNLFPDEWVESELGEIPKGWEVKALSDYASLNPESWSKKNFPNNIEYVDLANTKWGTVESTQLLSRETAPSRARRVLKQGDTIVGTVRPGKRIIFIGREKRPYRKHWICGTQTPATRVPRPSVSSGHGPRKH